MVNIKTKVVFSKLHKVWCLIDYDGYVIYSNKRPATVNKAKLYWYMYLTTVDNEESLTYIDKINKLEV